MNYNTVIIDNCSRIGGVLLFTADTKQYKRTESHMKDLLSTDSVCTHLFTVALLTSWQSGDTVFPLVTISADHYLGE